MVKPVRYIEWHTSRNNSLQTQVSNIMKHWESRYELGSAVILCKDPANALKLAEKQWRKLARQAQKHRETKASAKDILQITRTISRMQRVKFSNKDPLQDPDAKCYILSPDSISALPLHCYTIYAADGLPAASLITHLPADALIVAYDKPASLPGIKSRRVLEKRVNEEEARLLAWFKRHTIDLEAMQQSIEISNEALDLLLGSNALQTEFLRRTESYMHVLQLAQPIALTPQQQARRETVEQLERHVRVLSPAFLSDHIIDTQSDDAFLLRDLTSQHLLTLESIRNFITNQYAAGRNHLAAALEQKAGFIRV